MLQDNNDWSRASNLSRGQIIDVQGQIRDQDPLPAPMPYPDEPPPSVPQPYPYPDNGQPTDHYEPRPGDGMPWPPTMVSLAEGARVDNIAGRPIHEITGIQPGGNGARAVPVETDCICSLDCEDISPGGRSGEPCELRVWSEVKPGPQGDRGYPRTAYNSLVGTLEVSGSDQHIKWRIGTTDGLHLVKVSEHDLNRKLPREPLSGEGPCSVRVRFAIVPSPKMQQRLMEGNLAPSIETVTAFLDGVPCATVNVTINFVNCDLTALSGQARSMQDRKPAPARYVFEQKSGPVADVSDLGSADQAAPDDAAVALHLKLELTRFYEAVQVYPDCCCEYYAGGAVNCWLTSNWLDGMTGAAGLAANALSELKAFLLKDPDLPALLRSRMTAGLPRCQRAKACLVSFGEVVDTIELSFFYTAQEVRDYTEDEDARREAAEAECMQRALSEISRMQGPEWPRLLDVSALGYQSYADQLALRTALAVIGIDHGLDTTGLPNTVLNGFILGKLTVKRTLELWPYRDPSGGASCWCVRAVDVRVAASGTGAIRQDLDHHARDRWWRAMEWNWQDSWAQGGLPDVARQELYDLWSQTPRCFPSQELAEEYKAGLLEQGQSVGDTGYVDKYWVTPVRCSTGTRADDPIMINSFGMLEYKLTMVTATTSRGAPFFARHVEVERNSDFDKQAMVAPLSTLGADATATPPCCFLIWVHGYNTDESEAQENLKKLRVLYTGQGGCCRIIGFLWNGAPPHKSDWKEAKQGAEISVDALVYLLETLRSANPTASISVAGHSLGCRVICRAIQEARRDTVDSVVLFNAALDNECLEQGEEFHDVYPRLKGSLTVVYDRNDDVLGDYFLPLVDDLGAYQLAEKNSALGLTGPDNPILIDPGIRLFDATSEFQFTPVGDETHHSALYVQRASGRFFSSMFPSMLAGEGDYCGRK